MCGLLNTAAAVLSTTTVYVLDIASYGVRPLKQLCVVDVLKMD